MLKSTTKIVGLFWLVSLNIACADQPTKPKMYPTTARQKEDLQLKQIQEQFAEITKQLNNKDTRKEFIEKLVKTLLFTFLIGEQKFLTLSQWANDMQLPDLKKLEAKEKKEKLTKLEKAILEHSKLIMSILPELIEAETKIVEEFTQALSLKLKDPKIKKDFLHDAWKILPKNISTQEDIQKCVEAIMAGKKTVTKNDEAYFKVLELISSLLKEYTSTLQKQAASLLKK